MSADVRQGDIYHARPIRVIGTSSSGRIPVKLGQRSGPATRANCTDHVPNAQDKVHVKDNEDEMKIQRDTTPPLPPRGVKSILSVKDRFNSKKSDENRYVKFSDFEQKRLESKRISESGRVKALVEKRENSMVTPPPKLPPRNRDMVTSKSPSAAKRREILSVKQAPTERENGRVYPRSEKEIISAFDRLNAEVSAPQEHIHRGISPSTPEPQPLTRTNVTCHDQIWKSEEPEVNENDELSPPLGHITLESTQELLEKFDPLDVLDSASDHSESSADTMIMMTTEEEEQNKEKITQSMQNFRDYSSNKTKTPFSEQVELEITHNAPVTDFKSKRVTEETLNQLSPKSEDTDDGYGTNSSQGTTVSSPLSSSLNSLETSDYENSPNGNCLKQRNTSVNNSTSAINASSKTTWAVRRRTKMAENREDCNSVQEKLRQLAIIEEEEHQNVPEIARSGRLVNRRENPKRETTPTNGDNSVSLQDQGEINGPVPSDLRKFEGDLFDKFTDMDRNYRNYYGFDEEFERKDEKVQYFQQKKLKQSYGSDNYYNPKSYYQQPHRTESDFDPLLNLGQGSLPRNLTLGRDYSSHENSSYRSNATSGISSLDERPGHVSPGHMTNISYDQIPIQGSLPCMPTKGQFASLDNINVNGRRPLFASSADIHKLFQSRDNIHDQLQRPANCRHSFHAMPCTQQWLVDASQNQADANVPRQRAASASAAMKSKSSWNPFGGMFSRKKNKNEQNKSNQSLNTGESSREKNEKHDKNSKSRHEKAGTPNVPIRQPIIKSAQTNQSTTSVGRTPSFKRYAEKSGLATLPNGGIQELPFRTVAVVEPSGTKLSTLV